MKRILRKREGFATISVCGIVVVFVILVSIVWIAYNTSERVIYQTDDAITVSLASVALHDRYAYASKLDAAEICFYAGKEEPHYNKDDTHNMLLTKEACSFAFDNFLDLMLCNMPTQYLLIDNPSKNDIKKQVKEFKITNVYDGTAYVYDIISGTTDIITPAGGVVSILDVTMEIDLSFPVFGQKNIRITKTNKLQNRGA